MKRLLHISRGLTLACLCALLALAGCSRGVAPTAEKAPETLTKAQEQALVERVEGKWRAMEAWDYATTYDYTTPNYRRVFPKSLYLNKFGYDVRWELTGVDVLNYDAEAAVATVAVRVMSESANRTTLASEMGPIPDKVIEKWFYIDGEWWNSAK